MSQIDPKDQKEWANLVDGSIDEQANAFLRAFVLEFEGSKFEEILDLASSFKKFAPTTGVPDLEEDRALHFLEKRGEVHTAAELRKKLKEIDVDNNHRMAFLEYALFKYKKTPKQFFIELANPKNAPSEALKKAIAAYREVLAKKEAREKRMEELEKEAALGGVKGGAAKHTLEQMRNEDQLALNKAMLTSAAKKRAAEKAGGEDPFVVQQKLLEEEKKKREEEKKKEQAASRARLMEKSKMFGDASKTEVISSIGKEKPNLAKVEPRERTNSAMQQLKLQKQIEKGTSLHASAKPQEGLTAEQRKAFLEDRKKEKEAASASASASAK